jgi:chromosome segregation ATPase
MNRANKALVVLVVASLGLWGCAQERNQGKGNARLRALESKNSKLEDDFRAAVAARDQMKKKLQAAEAERQQLSQQLEELPGITKERDELRQQVNARIQEREALQAQFEQFRKGLRSLLGKVDRVANTSASQPVTSAAQIKAQEKS